jgi:hypothetical protein
MADKKNFLPDALPQRHSQKTNKFTSNGGFASSLEATQVTVSDSVTGGKYIAPTLDGVEFDRMRRYGLVLARWSLPDTAKRAKSQRVSHLCYESANRAVANRMFHKTFGEDPSKDTVNITPYVNTINSNRITPELLYSLAGFIGTGAYDKVLMGIKSNPISDKVKDLLFHLRDSVKERFLDDGSYLYYTDFLHSPYKRDRSQARWYFDTLARHIERMADNIIDEITKPDESKKRKATTPYKPKEPQRMGKLKEEDGWCVPYLAKYPLELPHTGKLGRRTIPTMEGKYPKNFHRLVTDPFRRIFTRKTRSLGGVVVFDCSGSMALSDDDIKQVLNSSAGCSVVCYSDNGSEEADRKHGNIHLVARNGRQMRGLPEFGGGNGVDLPALRYGYNHLRLNGKSPVIWVSDQQVTGLGGSHTEKLSDETNRFVKQHNIIVVNTPKKAIKKLTELQKGIRK